MASESLELITARHSLHFERLKTTEVKKFDKFLKRLDVIIREQLNSGTDITELSRTKMEKQLKLIGSLLGEVYDDYFTIWKQSITEIASYEAGFESRALTQVVDGVSFTLPSDNQLAAAAFSVPLGEIGGVAGGSLLQPYFKNMTKGQIEKVQGAIRIGYAQGQTTNEIIRKIRGTKAAKYNDGIISSSYKSVEAMTRTALQHTANVAREEVWNDNSKVIEKVKILAVIDKRTSNQCRLMDGQIFPIDKGPRPPFHIRCRTTTTAVLNKEYQYLSRNRKRLAKDPDTGEFYRIKSKDTYYDWLKRQPADYQDSIIGPTRGKLLRDGGLTSQRFTELQLTKDFEPLTTITKNGKEITPLEQMRQLEPLAFEKAGL